MKIDKNIIRTLLDVAKGNIPADTIITGGKIVNVFTNTIDEDRNVFIKNGYIVSVENSGTVPPLKASSVIDAQGLYLCPGFIDAHTHIDGMYSFSEFVPYSIRGGTTTIVTETSATACGAGMAGIDALMAGMANYPVRAYFLAPPLTPPFPAMERSLGLTFREITTMLKRDNVVGIGEAYWTRIVDGDDRVLDQALSAITLNKRLDGHAAGARGRKLIEYMLTGITSCHESVTLAEALEKLRLGLYVMIRQGSIRQELPELSKLKDTDVDTRRIILVSDFFDAAMLYEDGYLDTIGRSAIECGFSPVETIKMMTINPADYYGLRHLGAIAPFRYADIIFLSDLEKLAVEKVMSSGEIVYNAGNFLQKIRTHRYPEHLTKTITAKKITPDYFRIKAQRGKNTIRVIEIVNSTITKEIHTQVCVENGFLQKDLQHDIIPVAMINKKNSRFCGKGFIKGSGIKNGAVATTLTWDTGNILVLGSSEENMAIAVNGIIDMQGGTIVVENGKIIFEFPKELFGVMSLMSLENIAKKIQNLGTSLHKIGARFDKPFLNIQTIPFTGLPLLRITDKGLANVKEKRLVPLFVS